MSGPVQRMRQGRLAMRLSGMSPRRRLLGIVVAIAVLAAAAAGIAAGLAHSSPGQAGSATGQHGGPPQNRPGPVLLVPGYGGSTGALDALASQIRATGRTATVLNLPGAGTGSLVADAALLNSAVDNALAQGAPSVDVIGYSAGGVVALIWARRDDGFHRARRVITLGSPFHGTSLAAAAQAFVPGACPVACQQLTPGSQLLASLDAASPAGLPDWLSLWTTDDQTVTPPDSARLAGAIDVPVQSVCPAASISHSQLPTNPEVTAIVLHAISAAPLRTPTSADCH
ncbi:MAG TPA: alpha/beta fold hydrolase [Streptosporangiaceae bacterium]|jgi:triacylglycerol esterase/lipase EstA (alpha/beta hydrolase family)